MRFLIRAIGFVLLAAAFASLVVDGSRSIAGGRLLFYSVGEGAAWFGGARYGSMVGAAAGWPAAAQRALAGLLAVPGFLVTGLVGLALLYAVRSPAPGVGFSGGRS